MRHAFPALLVLLPAAVVTAAPVPQKVVKWVTVTGQVVWPEQAAIPERKDVGVTAKTPDGAEALAGGAVLDDALLVDPKTRGLRNVVVWIRPDDDDLKAAFPTKNIHPDLKAPDASDHPFVIERCRFDRRVVAVRTGDTLTFDNRGKCAAAARFTMDGVADLSRTLPVDKSYTTEPLDVKEPLPAQGKVGFASDPIHPWAQARVRAFDHPYFAVTDDRGRFSIPKVPVGSWRIVYWHETGFHTGGVGRFGVPLDVPGNKGEVLKLDPLAFEMPPSKK